MVSREVTHVSILEQQYSTFEQEYCTTPDRCEEVDVLFVGAGIGLGAVPYLLHQALNALGTTLRVGVVDAGPLSVLTHMAHTRFPRLPVLKAGAELFGGKLSLWGVSTPRPPIESLRHWPYPYEDLIRRFEAVEAEMGVHDAIPKSDGLLQPKLVQLLQEKFRSCTVRSAPLAINRDGRRWCPLDHVPMLAARGVHLMPRARCTALEVTTDYSRVSAVHGTCLDGRRWSLHPKVVVLGVGVEQSLPLIRQMCQVPVPLEPADHIRIDAHGSLLPESFGTASVDELGVGVIIMDCRGSGIPYHIEIKVAPRGLWSRGYMQSSDNLRGDDNDATLWIQVQAIAAMHDRLPATDLLRVDSVLSPGMSARDALFHSEIITVMKEVSTVLGLAEPTFVLRPLLTNHHIYGAFRVGKAVTADFRWNGVENLYVLPPTAYVDSDDDANPVLKSRVLAQYAMDAIVSQFSRG